MSKTATIPSPWRTLTSDEDSGDNGFTPTTDWFDCAALLRARCAMQVRNRTGLLELIPAIEFVDDVRDSSPTVVTLGSTWTDADGEIDPDDYQGLSTYADDHQLARFGFKTRNEQSQGSTLSTCDVSAVFEVVNRMRAPDLMVPWDGVFTDSGSYVFFPATEWVNTNTAVRFRCTAEAQGLTGNLEVHPAYQLADDPTDGGSATSMSMTITSDGVHFPGLFTSSQALDGKRLIRFGWRLRITAGREGFATLRGRFQREE